MTDATRQGTSGRQLRGAMLFALVWVVAAVARPTTTFHLAPAIVAAWPTLVASEPRRPLVVPATGFLFAASITAALSVSGMLQGPTLLPWGGPALEAVVAAAAGAIAAFVISLVAAHRITEPGPG